MLEMSSKVKQRWSLVKICGAIDSLKNKTNSNFNGKSLEVNKVMIFSSVIAYEDIIVNSKFRLPREV